MAFERNANFFKRTIRLCEGCGKELPMDADVLIVYHPSKSKQEDDHLQPGRVKFYHEAHYKEGR